MLWKTYLAFSDGWEVFVTIRLLLAVKHRIKKACLFTKGSTLLGTKCNTRKDDELTTVFLPHTNEQTVTVMHRGESLSHGLCIPAMLFSSLDIENLVRGSENLENAALCEIPCAQTSKKSVEECIEEEDWSTLEDTLLTSSLNTHS